MDNTHANVQQDLTETQMALEELSMAESQRRYAKRLERGLLETQPGATLARRAVGQTLEAVQAWLDEVRGGVPSRSASLYYLIAGLPVDTTAWVVCQEVLGHLGSQRPLTGMAMRIAQRLEDELDYLQLPDDLRKKYNNRMARQGIKDQRYRHICLLHTLKRGDIKRVAWGNSERARLGSTLIELFCGATGMAEVVQQPGRGGKTTAMVTPTMELSAWLQKAHERAEMMLPLYLPMVVPPRPWGPGQDGGYLTKRLRLPLVRTHKKGYLAELAERDMPDVYAALNAVQETAWRVNGAVLDIVQTLWGADGAQAGLPARDPEDIPEFPEAAKEDEALMQAWKREARHAYERNIKALSKRAAVASIISIAEQFRGYEAIYFPHNLDFRGRQYAVPYYLQPQGSDLCKGLLTFANGVPLGEEGMYWLAVHCANTYGVDKLALDDRVQWTMDNTERMLAVADDPLENRWWMDADGGKSPWRFLAACFEWRRLIDHLAAGREPETFVSSLPVAWDGSCNGLQNFSAMLRDPVGAAATNLIPQDKPADIYRAVAEAAEGVVRADAERGHVQAKTWAGNVTRAIAKRPAMTYAYGAGRYGYREQIQTQLREDAEKQAQTGQPSPFPDGADPFLLATYLAEVMTKAIPQVVDAAARAMSWLQEVARLAASEGLPVAWEAPSGFLVRQDYREVLGTRIDCSILGQRRTMLLHIDGDKVDRRRQGQGIAPNFVHSCDAAHLAATVARCRERGLRSFAMVHDSYGSPAGDAKVLRDTLRECFVTQYETPVLERFLADMRTQIQEPKVLAKLPPVPEMGDLDLSLVLQSEYFFA